MNFVQQGRFALVVSGFLVAHQLAFSTCERFFPNKIVTRLSLAANRDEIHEVPSYPGTSLAVYRTGLETALTVKWPEKVARSLTVPEVSVFLPHDAEVLGTRGSPWPLGNGNRIEVIYKSEAGVGYAIFYDQPDVLPKSKFYTFHMLTNGYPARARLQTEDALPKFRLPFPALDSFREVEVFVNLSERQRNVMFAVVDQGQVDVFVLEEFSGTGSLLVIKSLHIKNDHRFYLLHSNEEGFHFSYAHHTPSWRGEREGLSPDYLSYDLQMVTVTGNEPVLSPGFKWISVEQGDLPYQMAVTGLETQRMEVPRVSSQGSRW